jgi:hypothetical protein
MVALAPRHYTPCASAGRRRPCDSVRCDYSSHPIIIVHPFLGFLLLDCALWDPEAWSRRIGRPGGSAHRGERVMPRRGSTHMVPSHHAALTARSPIDGRVGERAGVPARVCTGRVPWPRVRRHRHGRLYRASRNKVVRPRSSGSRSGIRSLGCREYSDAVWPRPRGSPRCWARFSIDR